MSQEAQFSICWTECSPSKMKEQKSRMILKIIFNFLTTYKGLTCIYFKHCAPTVPNLGVYLHTCKRIFEIGIKI